MRLLVRGYSIVDAARQPLDASFIDDGSAFAVPVEEVFEGVGGHLLCCGGDYYGDSNLPPAGPAWNCFPNLERTDPHPASDHKQDASIGEEG